MKPKLHVLAIGINAYQDKGWTPPGQTVPLKFPPLSLAVSDAAALSAALKQAGIGQYAEVKVMQALDRDATLAGLEAIIERIGKDIHPRDTFVLFAAAHGTSLDGSFFLIPQDYDGGTTRQHCKIGRSDRAACRIGSPTASRRSEPSFCSTPASRARWSAATRARVPTYRPPRPPSDGFMRQLAA